MSLEVAVRDRVDQYLHKHVGVFTGADALAWLHAAPDASGHRACRALAQAQYLAGMDVNQSVKERCLRDPGFTVGPHPTFRGCLMNTGDCLYGLSELDVPPFGGAPGRARRATGAWSTPS